MQFSHSVHHHHQAGVSTVSLAYRIITRRVERRCQVTKPKDKSLFRSQTPYRWANKSLALEHSLSDRPARDSNPESSDDNIPD